MPIKKVIEILQAYKRYLDYMNSHGHDEVIDSVIDYGSSLLITIRGHMGETYEQEVWISDTRKELCINVREGEDLFELIDLEDYELTEEKLNYIKYGRMSKYYGKNKSYGNVKSRDHWKDE